jgi:hypothetical protein
MQEQPARRLTDNPEQPFLFFATDHIGEVNDSLPVRPDSERPSTQDLWEEMIKKQPRRRQPKNGPDIKRPGTGGQIDDYA